MDLVDTLIKFDEEELKKFIPKELKLYLPNLISKKDTISYIAKNIEKFLDEKAFVVLLLLKLSTFVDITAIKDKIAFVNGVTTLESKKHLLSFLGLKYGTEKIQIETEIDKLGEKRFFELLDYQYLIKEKVVNFVSDSIESGTHINKMIIHMPTGTGKTKTSVHTIISLYEKNNNKGIIVWLAHTEELLQQAKNAFVSAWGAIGNKKIKIIYNDVSKVYENDTIYFMSYQKLISFYKTGYDAYKVFRTNLSICVCDEAHKCLAQETYYALDDFMISYDEKHPKTLLGLTATPGRKYKDSLLEGDNLELAMMFDKHIFSIKTGELRIFRNFNDNYNFDQFTYKDIFKKDDEIIKYFQNRHVLAKIIRVPLMFNDEECSIDFERILSKKRNVDFSADELKIIGNNIKRNEKILDMLKKLDSRGIPTILFACSNEQGQLLSDVLTLNGIKNNCVFGDTKQALRRKYLKDFDDGKYNILINNAILTTGFDSPRIKCVFITRPTNSIVLYSQMLGRGLRGKMMGGNDECLLIDVVDNLNKFNNEDFAFNYFSVYWR